MAGENESRPDAVAELVRALREQVASHTEHIGDLERRLIAANQRIADQQRLLTRLLEKNTDSHPSFPVSLDVPRTVHVARVSSKPKPALGRKHSVGASAQAPIESAVAVIAPPVEPDNPEPANQTPPPAPVRLPNPGKSMPRLKSIADAVILARRGPSEPGRSDSRAIGAVQAYLPTTGIVRAAAGQDTPGMRETTLTLNREELAQGHRTISQRRRWFPFGRWRREN
jgi:hypothetical protein